MIISLSPPMGEVPPIFVSKNGCVLGDMYVCM